MVDKHTIICYYKEVGSTDTKSPIGKHPLAAFTLFRELTMDIFQREVTELVQKYLKEAYGRDMEVKELFLACPWYQIVGLWWESKAYFKIDHFYMSEDELPDPKPDHYTIYLGEGKKRFFERYKDTWTSQDLSTDIYK